MRFNLATDMRTEVIQCSPKQGRQYAANAGPNRFTQPIRVKLFEEIIADGYWRLTHQGIAFTSDGKLADGLHRCTAIGNGKITVPIQVTYNLPPESLDAIDLGKARSLSDIINIREKTPKRVTDSFVAVARAMVQSFSGSASARQPVPELIRLVIRHFDAINFVQENAPRLVAMIKAPVARAWYTKDRDRLAEFLTVAKTGISSDRKDTAAALLILRFKSENPTMSATKRAEWYRKTESAIQAFLQSRPLQSLCEVKHEIFPIPDIEEE